MVLLILFGFEFVFAFSVETYLTNEFKGKFAIIEEALEGAENLFYQFRFK